MEQQSQKVYSVDADSSNEPQKPPYVMLSENGEEHSVQPPPYRRNVPRYHSKTKRRRCRCTCLCCLCSCCFFWLFILVSVTALSFAFYMFYNPKLPNYSINRMDVTAFNLLPDFSLHTEFVIAVKAENPNRHLGIIYDQDSHVTVRYKGAELCTGSLPAFRQPHLNMTVLKVVLVGDSPFGSGLQEALIDNRELKRIPLLVFVDVPVSIHFKAINWKLGPVRVQVECNLVVDNLSPDEDINILSSDYSVQIKQP